MKNNISRWIMDYGVIAHRRFYRREKIRFVQRIEADFKRMDYQTKVLSPQHSKGKAINLLIGDVKTAKTIIIANYDTPVKSFGFFKYKPFDFRHRNILYITNVAIPLLIISMFCFFFSTSFLKIKWLLGEFHWQDIPILFIYLLGIILIVHYSKGISNSRNLQRNSSGVIGSLHLASMLDDNQRKTTAFVLTDYGCINHLGDQMLKAYLKTYDKQRFIILDCIGGKGTIAVCYSESFTSMCSKLDDKIQHFHIADKGCNAAHLYPNTMMISTGEKVKHQFVVPNVNTKKDMDIDSKQIDYICNQIRQII